MRNNDRYRKDTVAALKTEILTHENDVGFSSSRGSFEDEQGFTDSFWRVAVHAVARLRTGGGYVEAQYIGRSGRISRPCDGLVYVCRNLVHADDEDESVISPRHTAHSVAVSVNVHKHAVVRHRI